METAWCTIGGMTARSLAAPVPGTDFDVITNPAAGVTAASRVYAWGFDYAWGYRAGFPQVLVANGTQFVVRYLNDPGGKGITAAEAKALHESGIIIALVWEGTGTEFAGGTPAGLTRGREAAQLARSLGVTAGTLIWFAIDANTSDFASTNAFLRGAKSGTAEFIAQLYGSYAVVEAAAAAGLGSWQWQTYAWSAGKLSAHAALYQYQNGVMIGGVDCDRDQALQQINGPWASFGAVPTPTPPVPPPPVPPPVHGTWPPPTLALGATGEAVRTVQALCVARHVTVTVDGSYGPLTVAAVRSVQTAAKITADGTVGPLTWAALAGL